MICFVIHPGYRKQGIARHLLKHAVEDFIAQGFYSVLAIPFENAEEPEKLYRGTTNMYKEQSFEIIEQHDKYCIMQLKL